MADAYLERLREHPGFLLFLPVIAGFEFVRMGLFVTVLPGYLTRILHFGKTLVGFVFTLNLLADNILKPPFGWLVDRKGSWPVLWAGSIALAGGFLLMLQAQGAVAIMAAALIIGVAVSPSWPGVIAGATRALGEEYRGRAIGMISTAWLAAGGLGPVIAGWIIGSSRQPAVAGYPSAFILLGSVVVLTALVTSAALLIYFRRSKPSGPPATRVRSHQTRRWNLRTVLSDLAGGVPLLPGMLAQTLALGMLLPNMLPFAISQFGMTEAHYSSLLLIGGAATVLFMIPVGHLADRFGPRPFLASGFALASGSLLLVIRQTSLQPVFLLVGLLGLSYALIQPSWNTLLTGVIPPERRGTAMGLFMAVEGVGMAIGPALGGFLGDLRPFLPFYISGGILALMSLIYLALPFPRYQKG